MNRLQKKCVLATVGIHLLLLATLLVGPAFFQPRPKTENMQVLDVIPANLIDAAFNNGVRNAQPPPPAPVVKPTPPPPQPTPPAPKPVEPSPSLMQRVEKIFKPEPPKPAPEKVEREEPRKIQTPHKIQINTHLVTRTAPSNSSNVQNDSQRTEALQNVIRNLRKNFSPSTEIEMPGNSSAAYANYAEVVKSIYDQAWTLPDSLANANETVKVRVTIASDGTVISARIIEPSGDAALDASVRTTLERVTFIAPFPEGSSDKQRTYTISFNPQVKQML
jgi:TonB family protein